MFIRYSEIYLNYVDAHLLNVDGKWESILARDERY